MKDLFRFDMPIVRHTQEVHYLFHLLRLVQNVEVASEFRELDLRCFECPSDGFDLLNNADAW